MTVTKHWWNDRTFVRSKWQNKQLSAHFSQNRFKHSTKYIDSKRIKTLYYNPIQLAYGQEQVKQMLFNLIYETDVFPDVFNDNFDIKNLEINSHMQFKIEKLISLMFLLCAKNINKPSYQKISFLLKSRRAYWSSLIISGK